MSPVSDQQWLRQIGVDVTADTDDEDAGVSAMTRSNSTTTRAPKQMTSPPNSTTRHAAADSEPVSDPPPARVSTRPADDGEHEGRKDVRPRRYTPWVLGAFAGVAVVATVATTLGVMLSGPDAPPPRVHPSRPAPAPSLAAAPTTAVTRHRGPSAALHRPG